MDFRIQTYLARPDSGPCIIASKLEARKVRFLPAIAGIQTRYQMMEQKPDAAIDIAFADKSIGEDETAILYITDMINNVYSDIQRGIFVDGTKRTNLEEVKSQIAAQELALAIIPQSRSPEPFPTTIIGCIRINIHSPTRSEFGTLVTAPQSRGTGLGKKLVDFAEQHCRGLGSETMEIQLLIATTFVNPDKIWIQAWYERMGYKVVKIGNFADAYSAYIPLLKTDIEFRVFEKSLLPV